MGEKLSIAYDVRHFDAAGNEMNTHRRLQCVSIPAGVARDDIFYQAAVEAGAADYSVRLMRPEEIKQAVKEERKARGEDFMSQVVRSAGRIVGIDNISSMIAYLEATHNQPLTGIKK